MRHGGSPADAYLSRGGLSELCLDAVATWPSSGDRPAVDPVRAVTPPRAKKSLGQHFLTDRSVLAGSSPPPRITAGDRVLEIGPGRGALTGRWSKPAPG